MEKILVLNSGGFDSIVMLHDLKRNLYPEAEIHSIHFLYGALNESQQSEAVHKACEEFGITDLRMTLPHFVWSKSKFFNPNTREHVEGMYLEYRNLIFLSYAISYAESMGIKDIYFATLNGSAYNDTNPKFVDGMNYALQLSGIRIHTPYAEKYKEDLMELALTLDLHSEDFFSCDYPEANGEPCGICEKCKGVEPYLVKYDYDSSQYFFKLGNLLKKLFHKK